MVEPDGWIETTVTDPQGISWSKIKQGFAIMGIQDIDNLVSFQIKAGTITIHRIRRATRVDSVERVAKVIHE